MEKLLLVNASELVTVSGFHPKRGAEMGEISVVENGGVYCEDGVVKEVGKSAQLQKKYPDAPCLDCEGKAVLPGFVDSHTHFVFGGYRADEYIWRQTGVSYMEIMRRGGGIAASTTATKAASKEELYALGKKRLLEMLKLGVTTVEGKSGYGLDVETELTQLSVIGKLAAEGPMDVVPTFMGAHAVPPEFKGRTDDYVDFLIQTVLPRVKEQGIARFCDVFCEDGVFSLDQTARILEAARGFGMELKLHADEIVPLGGGELAAKLGAKSADHLLHVTEEGVRALAKSETVATLLPATAFCLKDTYAPARSLIDQGCAVAIASDFNPGSCFTYSIPLLCALAVTYMDMTAEEMVTALTLNGAAALGLADKIGSIDPGKQADFVILEFPSYRFLPYHTAVNCVERVVKKGKLVWDKRKESLC